MSEEERNGIDYLKILKETGFNKEKLDAVLNLIDKQQKEIEILKLTNNYLDIANKDYISKYKIKEILKKYSEKEDCTYKELIDFVEEIKELLEE